MRPGLFQKLQRCCSARWLALSGCVLVTVVGEVSLATPTYARGAEPTKELITTVKRVVDGDTIVVHTEGKPLHVRLRCVDTPEIAHGEQRAQPYGNEAKAFTRTALTGKRIRLVYHAREPWDRYHRLLAYVFLGDGSLFNADLVRQGMARVTRFRCSYRKQVKALEAEARRQRRGLWGGGR